MKVAGIEYKKPKVYLLQETGIGTAEFAARTCYDSFDKSENDIVRILNEEINENSVYNSYAAGVWDRLNNIEHSDLLDSLAWTHFHHSILEHCNLTYLIKGTSRAVLQEHARHRIQAISVRSTRYTMSSVLNAYNASRNKDIFIGLIKSLNMFTVSGRAEYTEINQLWDKLHNQDLYINENNECFYDYSCSKEQREILEKYQSLEWDEVSVFNELQNAKQKRNVGDSFKWIVTDNWKVDMVVTFNLRSLKNYFTLRDSNAAFFQIRWLAQAVINATPQKYLNLVSKKYKDN